MSPVDVTGELAILGGDAVCTVPWPSWPRTDREMVAAVTEVLNSGRWAVSGNWTGKRPIDMEFADRFAAFTGARWCLPVDHGSSALLVALTALGVRPGDEVIVPGLTWVACATAVLRAGAVPRLVDIDRDTLCLDPAAVAAAINHRTTAIIVVHLYSAMAEMDELRRIARARGIPIIEDAAQAHGARWHDGVAGALGDIGTFSMQQGKPLTSGEGGAIVTSSPELHTRMECLRGDGRRYMPEPGRRIGLPDLTEVGGVAGSNMHLSEIQAAMLLAGLRRLPEENAHRSVTADILDREFGKLPGYRLIRPYPGNSRRTYYHYVLRFEPETFCGRPADVVSSAVSAELGYWVHPPYQPLNVHPLYSPQKYALAEFPGIRDRLAREHDLLPVATYEAAHSMLFHHPLLLAPENRMYDVVEAVEKVRRNAHRLPADS